jgi:hypothetical protein
VPEFNLPRPRAEGTAKPGSARVGLAVALAGLIVAVVACLPAMLHLVVTSDGVNYLATADNLVHGNGYVTGLGRPATTWMPLYPLLVAAFIAVMGKMTAAAVAVNLLAVATVFVITWLLVRRWRGRTDWFTWFAAAATAFSPMLFSLAMFALSEALFAALIILLVYGAIRAETAGRWLWGVAVVGVAVALTRHIGVFALVAVAAAWRKPRYWLALLPGLAATVLWVLLAGTGDQSSGFSVGRGVGGVGLSLYGAATQLGGWPMLGLVVLALVFSRSSGVPKRPLLAALILLLLTALGGFFYVAGDLEGRMQAGAHVLLVPGLLTATSAISSDRLVRWAVYAGFIAFILYGVPGLFNPNTYYTSGVSFNAPAWRTRRSLEVIRGMPGDVDIYTNAQDGVWFATGRLTYELPRTDGKGSFRPRDDRGGLIVYFRGLNRTGYVPPEFYTERVLRDSTGRRQVENNAEALMMWVNKAR